MAVESGSLGFLIGEVSQSVGVSIQTLRLWERERLVVPQRTERGYRVYGEEDVRRLEQVKRLRSVEGLNFAAIRQRLGRAEPHGGLRRSEGPANEVGEQLRQLRLREHKTQKEVSEATGLSVSFVSSLERGATGASVESVRLLAGVYGIETKEILGLDPPRNVSLVRASERPGTRWESGVGREELTAGNSPIGLTRLRLTPRSTSGRFYSHDGEEAVNLLSGRLSVELQDQETFELSPGDTLCFSSVTPHRWWAGDEGAEALHVEVSQPAEPEEGREEGEGPSRPEGHG